MVEQAPNVKLVSPKGSTESLVPGRDVLGEQIVLFNGEKSRQQGLSGRVKQPNSLLFKKTMGTNKNLSTDSVDVAQSFHSAQQSFYKSDASDEEGEPEHHDLSDHDSAILSYVRKMSRSEQEELTSFEAESALQHSDGDAKLPANKSLHDFIALLENAKNIEFNPKSRKISLKAVKRNVS